MMKRMRWPTLAAILAVGLATGVANAPSAAQVTTTATTESSCRLNSPGGQIQHVVYLQFDNTHYLLTAAHVWQPLKRATQVCLNIRSGNHRFGIPQTELRATTCEPTKGDYSPDGPDLCFIRIPAARASTIGAAGKIFYNLGKRKQRALATLPPEDGQWAIMGAPETEITASPTYAAGKQIAFLTPKPLTYRPEETHDYLTIALYNKPPAPASFKGVSGGGVWQILHNEQGQPEPSLEGVAFYQDITTDVITIHCHARHSIYRNLPVDHDRKPA